MKIRKASSKDLTEVHKLVLEMYAEERATLDPHLKEPAQVSKYYLNLVSEKLSDDDAAAFIAEEAGQPAGFALAYLTEEELHTYSRKAYIRNIYVREAYRKQGVGSHLLSRVLAWAGEKRAEVVEADAYATNAEGLAFWEKEGFEPKFTLIAKKIS